MRLDYGCRICTQYSGAHEVQVEATWPRACEGVPRRGDVRCTGRPTQSALSWRLLLVGAVLKSLPAHLKGNFNFGVWGAAVNGE